MNICFRGDWGRVHLPGIMHGIEGSSRYSKGCKKSSGLLLSTGLAISELSKSVP